MARNRKNGRESDESLLVGTQVREELTRALLPAIEDLKRDMEQVFEEQINDALEAGLREQRAPVYAETPELLTSAIERLEKPAQEIAGDGEGKAPTFLSMSLDVVRQEGRGLLHSLLSVALVFLLSEQVRLSLQQQLERALKPVLEATLKLAPDSAVRLEVERQAVAALQGAIRESLGTIFSAETRAEMERRLDEALDALLANDVNAMRSQVEAIGRLLLQKLATTVPHYKALLPRLFAKILLTTLEGALASVDEAVASPAPRKTSDEVAHA